jgi:hypothetical protein
MVEMLVAVKDYMEGAASHRSATGNFSAMPTRT